MEGDEYDWKFQVVCAHKHAGKWCVRERLFAIGRRKETEQTGGSGSSVDVLKIDTEGNDGLVLLGAAETLRSPSLKLVYFEYAVAPTWFERRGVFAAALAALEAASFVCFFGGHLPRTVRITGCADERWDIFHPRSLLRLVASCANANVFCASTAARDTGRRRFNMGAPRAIVPRTRASRALRELLARPKNSWTLTELGSLQKLLGASRPFPAQVERQRAGPRRRARRAQRRQRRLLARDGGGLPHDLPHQRPPRRAPQDDAPVLPRGDGDQRDLRRRPLGLGERAARAAMALPLTRS